MNSHPNGPGQPSGPPQFPQKYAYFLWWIKGLDEDEDEDEEESLSWYLRYLPPSPISLNSDVDGTMPSYLGSGSEQHKYIVPKQAFVLIY